MNIEYELKEIIKNKTGNKELAIFYNEGNWNFMLGNTHTYVSLGESVGEFEADGETLEEAINNMKQKMGIV